MFRKAERTQVKPKIAITGPSGAGKTMGALILAQALGKRIAVIDTENGSASTYADRFDFDTIVIRPPYTVEKYIAAADEAIQAKYDVLVVDSLSHAWAGDGGLLMTKESLDTIPGSNHFANWAPISKLHERFKAFILNAPISMVCTMRSKQDYVLVKNEKGKDAPQKVGTAPIQREGMEYEFMTVFDVDMTHQVTVSKDRTSLFDGKRFKITKKTGEELVEWLNSAKPAPTPGAEPPTAAEPLAPALARELQDQRRLSAAREQQPNSLPQLSGAACNKCGTEIRINGNASGYVCPQSKERGDGHARVLKSRLEEYRTKFPLTPQQAVSPGT